MDRNRFARGLKVCAVVAGLYAVGAWTMAGLIDEGPRWGVIDRFGTVIVPPTYEEMGPAHNDLVPVRLGDRWGLIDARGKVVLELKYGPIEWSGSGWYVREHRSDEGVFWSNSRAGWADASGKLVIAPEYQTVRGEGIALRKDNQWTLRDEHGKVVVTRAFDTLGEFTHGMAAAGTPKNLGVIDRQGKWLITPRFARLYICGPNCVAGLTGGAQWQLYDRNGKPFSGAVYTSVSDLGHGFFRAHSSKTESTVFNTSGARPVEAPFQDMREFSERRAAIRADGKWGYADARGRVAIAPAYDEARPFHDGVAPVRQGKTWHLIDEKGGKAGNRDFQLIAPIRRGLSFASGSEQIGYIDKSGSLVFAFGESSLRLLDSSGKQLGHAILARSPGSHPPAVLSATALAVADYPPSVRRGAALFSLGRESWVGSLDRLAVLGALVAFGCVAGAFLFDPEAAARLRRGLGSMAAGATGAAARRAARQFGKAAVYMVAGFAALAALLLLINAFDEDLQPEVAAYLKPTDTKVPAAQNGYFQLIGLSAKAGAPHAVGQAFIHQVEQAQAKRLQGENASWPELGGMTFKDPGMCNLDSGPCLAAVAENEQGARQVLADNKLLLERYRALMDYPAYEETQRLLLIDAPLPHYLPLTHGQRLLFMQAALRVREGQVEAAAADVEKSLALSRRMLAGSRSLIGKMIATAQAQRSALFLSEILSAHRAGVAPRAAALAEALRPLSAEERGLGEALRSELAGSGPAALKHACRQEQLAMTLDAGAWLSSFPCALFQPNATVNRMYFAWHKPFVEIDAAPAAKFEDAVKTLRPAKGDFFWLTALYNPTGKVLLSVGGPDWSEYTARMHDADALLRLVALQALIVAKRAGNAEIPGLAAQAGSRYANPYTGAPMQWDAARKELYFEPKSPRMKKLAVGGRISVIP